MSEEELNERRYSLADFYAWRGIEKPCKGCGGTGHVLYGSTSTWSGGVGGCMMTPGVCDRCWGSGDAGKPWANLRELQAKLKNV